MKNLFGIQLGNTLINHLTTEPVIVAALTDKKIITTTGKTLYLDEISEVYLTDAFLEEEKKAGKIFDYQPLNEGGYVISPKNSINIYELRYLHEYQNFILRQIEKDQLGF